MEDRTAPNAFAQAAIHVSELLDQFVVVRGKCLVVVSGGSAVQHTLKHLATCDIQWSSVRLYMADERCMPREDRHRNDAMISKILVRPALIESEHFFQIPAELGPHHGAQLYGQTLASIDHFDIALLGVGPDGHIASLFPNHPSIESDERVVAVENSPKFPPNRVSIGLAMLRGATHRIVLVIGDEKRDLVNRLQGGEKSPVALVKPTRWFFDSPMSEMGFP